MFLYHGVYEVLRTSGGSSLVSFFLWLVSQVSARFSALSVCRISLVNFVHKILG